MNKIDSGIVLDLIDRFQKKISECKKLQEENDKLSGLVGRTTQQKESLTNELQALSETLRFNTSDLVDASIGMKIDSKILIPIQASDLSQDLLDTLNLISISDMTKKESATHIVGSYKWRAHKYPGDIDMMEVYKANANSEAEASLIIKDELQKVATKINKNPHVKLADFKCGFDARFDNLVSNLGQTKQNYVLPDMIAFFEKEIPGYNQNVCVNEINNLERVGAINAETKALLQSLLPQGKMTGDSYFEIFKVLRKLRLLRWLIVDILNGYKVKPSLNGSPPYSIKLEDAVRHNTFTKLDLWAKVGTRWTEITNFFVFQYGANQSLGFKFTMDIDDAVKYDIAFYSSPGHEKNPKVAKRIWARSISHLTKCVKGTNIDYNCMDPTQLHIIKKLYPLFSSDVNKVSQIIGDIELFNAALDKRNDLNLSYSFIFKDLLVGIESAPQDLFRILHLGNDANEMTLISANVKQEIEKILGLLKKAYPMNDFRSLTDQQWDDVMTPENIESMKHSLETIEKILKKKQDEYAKAYLIENKLHPGVKGSIIQIEYKPNHLNLPKVKSL